MKTFSYEAVDDAGKLSRGQLPAGDEQQLQKLLEQRGLTLVRLLALASRSAAKEQTFGQVPRRELAEFARYVSLTARAGLPLMDCLDDFAGKTRSVSMRRTLTRVAEEVRHGTPLAEAFGHHPRAFDSTFVSMIHAGESSGTLDAAMSRAAEQIDFQASVRGQLKSAFIAPAFLVIALTGLVILLLTFLLPRLLASMSGSNVIMPLPTRIVMAASDVLTSHATPLIAGVVGCIVGLRLLMFSSAWRLRMNLAATHLPVIGPLLRMSAEARFAGTMSALLASGIDAVRSLQMAAETTGAPYLRERLLATAERVREGQTLSEALTCVKGLHPLLLRMLQLGERTGNLDQTLAQAAAFYAVEIPRGVKRALQILEPCIVVCAGGTVAFIVLATILPIFSMYDSIG